MKFHYLQSVSDFESRFPFTVQSRNNKVKYISNSYQLSNVSIKYVLQCNKYSNCCSKIGQTDNYFRMSWADVCIDVVILLS